MRCTNKTQVKGKKCFQKSRERKKCSSVQVKGIVNHILAQLHFYGLMSHEILFYKSKPSQFLDNL